MRTLACCICALLCVVTSAMDWCDSTYSCRQTPDDNVGLRKLISMLSKEDPDNQNLAQLASIGSCALVVSMCDEEYELSPGKPVGADLAYMVKTLCSTTCQICPSSINGGGGASCEDDDVGIVAAVPNEYRSYVTNCAGLPSTVILGTTLNLCTQDLTKDVAEQYCPVTCDACPSGGRRQLRELLTTNPPASIGDFSLSSSGCRIGDEIVVKQHTELTIRGDPNSDHLPIIQPIGLLNINVVHHRLFKVIGMLILEHVHLKGGNTPYPSNECSQDLECFLTDRCGAQVYVGDTVGGLLTSNIALLNATDVLFTQGGLSTPPKESKTYGGSICAVGNLVEHGSVDNGDAWASGIPSDVNISQVLLTGSTLSDSRAAFGGGIAPLYSTLKLIGGKNVIENNTAVQTGQQILFFGSAVTFSECPPGKYFSGVLGAFRDSSIVGCPSICPVGKYGTGFSKRVPGCPNCPSGSYCPSIFKPPIKCDAGRYSEVDMQVSQESCLACNGGKYVNKTGSSLCFECAPGKYQDQQGKRLCKSCALNFFQESENKKICESCPAGFVSTVDSTTLCTPCSVGKFVDGTSKQCQQCPTGWLQEEEARTECKKAKDGRIVLGGGATSVQVPDGSYLSKCETGGTSCSDFEACPSGWIGSKPPGTVCASCEPGKTSFTGAVACLNCAKGKYSGTAGSDSCSDCGIDQYQPQERVPSVSCSTCPAGFTQNKTGESSCDKEFAVETKKECATTGKYLNQTSKNSREWKCEECPAGAWCGREEGGVTQDEIEAKFGWYRLQNKTINKPPVFRKCPYPLACLGKPNPAFKGIFKDEDGTDLAMVGFTNFQSLSPRNSIEMCNKKYGHANSFLCADCLPSYSHSGFTSKVLTCSPCPEQGANALILAVLGLLLLLVIFIMMFLKFRGAKHPKIKAAHSTLKRIVVSHLQVVGVVMALDVPWPQSLQDLIGAVSSTVSLEGRMLSGSRCASAMQDTPDAVTLYQTTMVLTVGPIFATMLIYLYWRFVAMKIKILACGAALTLEKVHEELQRRDFGASQRSKRMQEMKRSNEEKNLNKQSSSLKRRKSTVGDATQVLKLTPFDATVATITLLLYLLYPSITAATFSMMKCEIISNTVQPTEAKAWVTDDIVLVYDRDEICWQGRHLDFTIAVSIPVLILYIVGLPMAGLFVLFRRRQKLDTSQNTVFRFGLLYSGYTSKRWWWEAVTTLRKVVIIACATFLTGDAMQLQVLLGFVFAVIGLNSLGEPFNNGTQVGLELALVEGASLGLLFVTVWSGMFFINFNKDGGGGGSSANFTITSDGVSDTCKGNGWCDFLVFLVILLNISFLILTLRRLFQYFEKRTKIIQKVTQAVKKKIEKKTKKTKKKETKKRSINDGDRSNKQRKWCMLNHPKILNLELIPMSGGTKLVTAGVADDSINDDEKEKKNDDEKNDEMENETKSINNEEQSSMDEIQIHIDEESGRRYSYNAEVEISTWLDDENEDGEEVTKGMETAEEGDDLDVGVWEKTQDSDSGDWYEYNTITEETRWLEDLEEDAFEIQNDKCIDSTGGALE